MYICPQQFNSVEQSLRKVRRDKLPFVLSLSKYVRRHIAYPT